MTQLPPRNAWPPWMLVAEREIGVHELPGDASEKRIEEYLRATRLDEQAINDSTSWCSAFVSWCLRESGMKNPRYALARNYTKYGDSVVVPSYGDIVVLSRGSNSIHGHVGFFTRDLGDTYELLSGNSNNRVRVSPYPKSAVLGIRRPREPQ